MIIRNVPVLIFEDKRYNNHIYDSKLLKGIIKKIKENEINGKIYYYKDNKSEESEYKLKVENPIVNLVNYDDSSDLTLFCDIKIINSDEKIKNELLNEEWEAFVVGKGEINNEIIDSYDLCNINIEISKK